MSKLSDCVYILDSKRIPLSSKERKMLEKKYPYYGAQGIVDYVDNYLFDGDYILVAEDGNNLKSLNEPITTWASGKFWVNNHAHILGEKEGYCLRYIYYLLSCMDLRGCITGSAQPKLNQDNLSNIEIHLPDEPVQIKVAGVLSALDDKITINRRILVELELLAKTLYDYWFTQLDFPNDEGKPYRASDGEMKWNDQLKRKIPKGWDAGTVNSIMRIDNSSIDPRKFGDAIMEHYSIPAFDDGRYPAFEPASAIESGKYAVDSECILTSKLNPQFKRLWDPYCETPNAICSTEFIVYRPREAWTRPYCYAVLNSDAFYAYMATRATASTGSRKRIQPEVSAAFPIAIPDEQTMRSFVAVYKPIMKQIKNLHKENHELAKLRDWLLPMLMNGQAIVE